MPPKDPKYKFKFQSLSRVKQSLLLICSVIVVGALINLFFARQLFGFDLAILSWFYDRRRPDLTWGVQLLTRVGYEGVIVLVTLLSLGWLLRRRYRLVSELLLVTIGGGLLNTLIKQIVQRHRPEFAVLTGDTTFSFPSGHTMAATLFFGFMIQLVLKSKIIRPLKILISVSFGILIVSIGLSRIYLGVHYPTDVLGGFGFGVLWILLVQLWSRRIDPEKHVSGFSKVK